MENERDIVVCPAERHKRARLAGKLTVWTRVRVPSKRLLTITHPWCKNPFSIANKISGYIIFEDKIWLAIKFRRINQTNYELAMSWSRCPDWNAWAWQNNEFPAERRVALTTFCRAHNDMSCILMGSNVMTSIKLKKDFKKEYMGVQGIFPPKYWGGGGKSPWRIPCKDLIFVIAFNSWQCLVWLFYKAIFTFRNDLKTKIHSAVPHGFKAFQSCLVHLILMMHSSLCIICILYHCAFNCYKMPSTYQQVWLSKQFLAYFL